MITHENEIAVALQTILSIISIGVLAAFLQTAFSALKQNDWGKLDDCEYIWIILRCAGQIFLFNLILVIALYSLWQVAGPILTRMSPVELTTPAKLIPVLFLWGFLPPVLLLRSARRVRKFLISCLLDELRLRLIVLHAKLAAELETDGKSLSKFVEYFNQNRARVVGKLKAPHARKVKPEDPALLSRMIMEYLGYRRTAKLIGLGGGFFFAIRPLLCTLLMFSLAILLLLAFQVIA